MYGIHSQATNGYGESFSMDSGYGNQQLTPYPQQQQGPPPPIPQMRQQQQGNANRRVRTPGPQQQQQQYYHPSPGPAVYRNSASPPHIESGFQPPSQPQFDGGHPGQGYRPPPSTRGYRGGPPMGGGYPPMVGGAPYQQQPPPPHRQAPPQQWSDQPLPVSYPLPPSMHVGGGRGGRGGRGGIQQQQQQQQQQPPVSLQQQQQPPISVMGPLPMPGGDMATPPLPQPPYHMGTGTPIPLSMMPTQDDLDDVEMADNRRLSFYNFLVEKQLLKLGRLQDFFPADFDAAKDRPLCVAMDGDYILGHLRGQLQARDPLWFLHSPLPDRLLELVSEHVALVREKHMEPIWVFNGIGISGDVEAFLPSREEVQARTHVWEKLSRGDLPTDKEITEAFDTSSSIGEDVIMCIQRFLQTELQVLAVTAPFLNWCQIATFHAEGQASLLVGPPEMLLVPYEPVKLIVEINLGTDEVAYFDREEVLQRLFPLLSPASAGDCLLDFGLLCATHPAITAARANVRLGTVAIYDVLSVEEFKLPSMKDFITQYESRVQDSQRTGSQVLKHAKGRNYICYSAVVSSCVPDSPVVYFKRALNPRLTNAHMPSNLSGVFGNLVPLSLFYLQHSGLLSVSLMTIVTQSYFRDEYPVSNSLNYQTLLHKLVILRGQTLCQLVLKLHKHNQQRLERISWVRWFGPILVSISRPTDIIELDDWDISDHPALKGARSDDLSDVNIDMVLRVDPATACIPRNGPKVMYRGRKQTFLVILLRAFDFLGYFSHATPEVQSLPEMSDGEGVHTPSNVIQSNGEYHPQDGSGAEPPPQAEEEEEENIFFAVFLSQSLQHCPPEFQSGLVRFTEMIRVNVLNTKKSTYVFTRNNMNTPEVDGPGDVVEVLLASRIACLVSIPYLDPSDTFEWAPVYSRHLCAFSVMTRSVNRHLRELMEVITASVFLSNQSDCSLADFTTLTSLLPFEDVPSAIGGLLLHYVLVFPADYESGCETRQARCEHLQLKFKAMPNVAVQLEKVMSFTFYALFLLNAYRQHDPKCVSSLNLVRTDVVIDTLGLLYDKWLQHLDSPPPEDIHGLWHPEYARSLDRDM